jgi:cytochrome c oxidase subunit 2
MLTDARMLELHQIALCVYIVGGIIVVGAMFYAIFAHRRANRPNFDHFHESMLVELIWTTIPILILLGLAIPTTTTIW